MSAGSMARMITEEDRTADSGGVSVVVVVEIWGDFGRLCLSLFSEAALRTQAMTFVKMGLLVNGLVGGFLMRLVRMAVPRFPDIVLLGLFILLFVREHTTA